MKTHQSKCESSRSDMFPIPHATELILFLNSRCFQPAQKVSQGPFHRSIEHPPQDDVQPLV